MAVTIRLARHGKKKFPLYRIVAAEKTSPRDGRYIELLGTYNPKSNPPAVALKEERVKHWLQVGARPSSIVRRFISAKLGDLFEARETHRLEKIKVQRKARKTRTKKVKKAAKAKE